nr:MAG TPA: helix-turn-helix domain-containing protein [Caudoviricetes sp.]
MKAVLRSVKPFWLYLILTGKKTIEVGKSCPRAKDWNKVVEMYCSKDMRSFNRIPEEDKEWMHKYLGKVACRFVCEWVGEYESNFSSECDGEIREVFYDPDDNERIAPIIAEVGDKCGLMWRACMSWKELRAYMGDDPKTLYAWYITELKIYDKPKELRKFYKVGAKSLEELDDELCRYCAPTKYGERRVHLVPNAGAAFCEGDYCEEAYRTYLEQEFALTRPPESWCYVQELEERK